MKKILDRGAENHEHIKMSVSCNNGDIEELMSCNEPCDVVKEQHEHKASGEVGTFAFREVPGHQGLMAPGDACCKGLKCDVKVPWKDGLMMWEPLRAVAAVCPVTLAC